MTDCDYGWLHFASVIEWGLRDSYSRERLVGSFTAAAKCYDPLAAKHAGAPTVRCDSERSKLCEGEFKPTPQQARSLQQGERLLCPACEPEEERWLAEVGQK